MSQVARENQRSRFGTVSLDCTKIHANASRHSAFSYARADKIEAKPRAEMQKLMALAGAVGTNAIPDGVNLPDEITRREDRLAAIAQAKATIEARAQARTERERAEYQAKLAATRLYLTLDPFGLRTFRIAELCRHHPF